MKNLLSFLPALLLIKTINTYAQPGAGSSLYFTNTVLSTDSVVRHNIGRKDFTYEVWVNPTDALKTWHGRAILSNGYAAPALYAASSGFSLSGGDGSCGAYMTGTGWINSGLRLVTNRWSHVAMVRHDDTITFYVNGIAGPYRHRNTDSIANDFLYLGFSHAYFREYFDGAIDEVRIWNVARTEQELRVNMCRRLSGTEPGLFCYFPLNEGKGTVTGDGGTSGRKIKGIPPSIWRVSSAPLGDTSAYLYAAIWRGKELQINSATRGNLKIDSIKGLINTLHVYRIDSVPNTHNGISSPTGNGGYYGVFVGQSGYLPVDAVHYNLQYNYTNYPTARANESNIRLYNRPDNAGTLWTDFGAKKNTTAHHFKVRDIMLNREVLIAETAPLSCTAPESLYADTVTASSALISFDGSPADWNIEYGINGFSLGSGKRRTGTALMPALLDTLIPFTEYDVYVQQNCSGASSKWTGPYKFITGESCPAVTSIGALYLGNDSARLSARSSVGVTTWNLEYGPKGHRPGAGTYIPGITTADHLVTGLLPGTAYDFYVQDTCSNSRPPIKRGWVGPVTIITQCPAPTNLLADYLGADTARVSWSDKYGDTWNIEYGVKGYTRGSGIFVPGITSPSYIARDLNLAAAYDFYVQDTCGAAGNAGKWIGPVTVYTTCPAPTSMWVNYLGYDSARVTIYAPAGPASWNLEYGIKGYTRGTGTFIHGISTPAHLVTGLRPGASYDFYTQDTCMSATSASSWIGPVSTSITGTALMETGPIDFSIYPNPGDQQVTLQLAQKSTTPLLFEILSSDGRQLRLLALQAGNTSLTINTTDFAPGIYLIRMNSEALKKVVRLVVIH